MEQFGVEWPCPLPGGGAARELAMGFDTSAARARVLVVPALFDEANRLRRFTIEVMRRLAGAGVACVLPEVPGLGDSLADLTAQTPGDWLLAMEGAGRHFAATHVLALRGGALIAPRALPGWRYAPVTGQSQLRQMLRARIVAAREAGAEETQDSLMALGREQGLELAGYRLGADFLREFPGLVADGAATPIAQDMVGGPGLWMRAEPGEAPEQADALAAIVAMALRLDETGDAV